MLSEEFSQDTGKDSKDTASSKRNLLNKINEVLPTVLFIFLPLITFVILISRVTSLSSDETSPLSSASKTNSTALTLAFREATPQQINDYILLSWYDNMFIVAFGLFIAGLFSAIEFSKPLIKVALFCTTIPGHPISDWIENTASVMAYISFSNSEDQVVDEYWTNQYHIWSMIKWSLLGFNILALFVFFVLWLRCNKISIQSVS
mmetsp:Transcript_10705/g.13535  ORF Transcript_10705/g.13535 Transcript_10705/m.13535 type:complete len:205 (+) Transcript_10705:117-731(+)